MNQAEKRNLEILACKARMGAIIGTFHAKSAADMFTYLYFKEMNVDPANPDWADRDRFVLSKGHCCPSLYAVLALKGYFDWKELEVLRHVGAMLQGHPDMKGTPGIDMSSGSLGQGVSAACGMALAAKMDKRPSRVYVLMGDGELAEGSVWEGAMSGHNYNLDNLCAIVDRNHLQISGNTEDVMKQDDQAQRWAAFGWNVIKCDGNDFDALEDAFAKARAHKGDPTVIIADTVKGKGSPIMENKAGWHHHLPNQEEYEQIMKDLEAGKEAAINE